MFSAAEIALSGLFHRPRPTAVRRRRSANYGQRRSRQVPGLRATTRRDDGDGDDDDDDDVRRAVDDARLVAS